MLNFKYSALTPSLFLPLILLLSSASEAAPTYSDHYCTPGTFFTPNSTFQSNLNLLLSSLTSNASLPSGFYRTTVSPNTPDIINGLFLCRGDVNATVCQDCVTTAAEEITRRCPNQKVSIIWYDVCLLRYSNKSFNYITPGTSLTDGNNVSSSDMERFNDLLASFLNDLAAKAANSHSEKKFATGEVKFTTSQTLYRLAQCVPDLSSSYCNTVFQSAIGILPTCCTGKLGATVLLPGANIRYEPYPFYSTTATSVLPPSSSGKSNSSVIVAIVVPIVVGVALFVVGYCYLRRRASKNHKAVQEDSIVNDLPDIESLQFDLATIEAATNGFSDEKKIGQGGFGMVYKGTLPNGEEVAVKRLSESSLQGRIEFKNEAALVAKLQHRNLVRVLGFCVEGKEKILVYEYIPNMSLDRFLFDPDKRRELDWSTRYNITVGIARGILYLHEDSRLKIIHRDLKVSNVLLDFNMNAKISDFGMAKIFLLGQTQVNARTGRIVGTFGYMSPEYAMHRRYSVKSDVFSFGVLVLEIVSGKKNTNFYQSNLDDDLLSYAWKTWTNGTPLQLLDPSLGDSCPRNEVIRCIHMGLLCVQENPADRPSMATVALMLNSYSLTLSNPRQPASFLRGTTTPSRAKYELDSGQSSSSTFPLSLNEVSITELYPR